MTNGWTDMANSTLFVVMGANPVENHPASAAHVLKAVDLRGAKLIVIDPRKTRTALLALAHGGRYIRIRPGTDIAFINGVIRGLIRQMEGVEGSVEQAVKDRFWEFLNQSMSQTFTRNDGADAVVAGGSKYTDARFLVNGSGSDYVRFADASPTGIDFFPDKSTDCRTGNTVFNRLKAHVEPYDPTTVAEVCGCTAAELEFVTGEYIEHSRMKSSVLTGDSVIGVQDPRDKANYRAVQMMYAMGLTQHTHGAQNVKAFATLMTLTGNIGRAGGAINALRGIHNVQGSTDQGVLRHLIPGYSGNPVTLRSADPNAFGKYCDNLWGRATRYGELPYDDAYRLKAGFWLQSDGFYNMTLKWFGDWAPINGMPFGTRAEKDAKRAAVDAIYDLWPKTDGDDHITMFRKMIDNQIKGCVVWGQNPAVTEPNQSKVRAGLKNLDILVVVDMFETETAAADRKDGAVTYLIPAAAHPEEAGSVANSGRVLQWRERASKPKGNSKSDLELLLRLAYAFDKNGAFDHIKGVWQSAPLSWTLTGDTPVYDKLYKVHGWSPADATPFEEISTVTEMWYAGKSAPDTGVTVYGSEVVAESIYKEMNILPSLGGTMWLYLDAYSTNRATRLHTAAPAVPDKGIPAGTAQTPWAVDNRAKSRDMADGNSTYQFPGWGYAWLVNRRVLYNNGDNPGDVADRYQTPDQLSRLFVPVPPAGNTIGYGHTSWRRIHGLADRPDTAGVHVHPGRFPSHTEPYETPLAFKNVALLAKFGRNTAGGTPWNLVKADTPVAGRGTAIDPQASEYPFVLTTIRCVEHFQGGPITRNNPWNVEAEPQPWIEVNSVDAAAHGIRTGDMINVITARGDSTTAGQRALSPNSGNTSMGFVARVGVGAEDNQRVGPGVVAIPWHWGDKGLSTGSRANDLCIDSWDANTQIPEYKACLCKIEKM